MRNQKILLVLLAGVVSAALAYLGTGLQPIWWCLWLAPIPVLAVATHLGRGPAFLLAVSAWLLGALNEWNYFTHGLQLPLPLIALVLLLPALFFGLCVLFARSFLRRGSLFLGAIAFPAAWVAYEYLSEIGSPHSTFGNLGYTQMDFLPIIQIASVTGIWGISFIVFLFAGTMAALLSGAGRRGERGALALSVGALLCVLLFYGEWRLSSHSPAPSVAVTLMAKDVPMGLYLGSDEQALKLMGEYADEVRRATPSGTQVVVLPEKIARLSESNLAQVDALFAAAAAEKHTAIVLGVVRKTSAGAFNSARFYSAEGNLEANYDKHHLLPGVEPEKPGSKRVVLDEPSGRWGLQICKDMDFPLLSSQYAAEGANLLLVPAWDFGRDRWLHSRMAMLRGVENGFALARSARDGLLTLSDNRGRILAETAGDAGRFVSVTGQLSVGPEQTFYTRSGDWFAWICLALTVILLAGRFLWPQKRHPDTPSP